MAGAPAGPDWVTSPGAPDFPLSRHLFVVDAIPMPDWPAVERWLDALAPDAQDPAWIALQRAWLQHLGQALGPAYRLLEGPRALVLSSLEPAVGAATLGFMDRTLDRILRLLEGIAEAPAWGKGVLVVLDDADTYYRYIGQFYPGDGEAAGSSGMYIPEGCDHFVTMKADLGAIEPTIVHEMTHGCLVHLPLPVWLHEGLAVNTERRLSPGAPPMYSAAEMRAMHRAYWDDTSIQAFWSGQSFFCPGNGNLLSYDLAQVLVEQFSGHWDAFRAFVRDAHQDDAGAAAASRHLGIDLGIALAAVLERPWMPATEPRPATWAPAPGPGPT
jgi:hypothetical protein